MHFLLFVIDTDRSVLCRSRASVPRCQKPKEIKRVSKEESNSDRLFA
jgi:hypothetical protein